MQKTIQSINQHNLNIGMVGEKRAQGLEEADLNQFPLQE